MVARFPFLSYSLPRFESGRCPGLVRVRGLGRLFHKSSSAVNVGEGEEGGTRHTSSSLEGGSEGVRGEE